MIYNHRKSTQYCPVQQEVTQSLLEALDRASSFNLEPINDSIIKAINDRFETMSMLAHKIYLKSLNPHPKRFDTSIDYANLDSSQLYPYESFSVDGTMTYYIDTTGKIMAQFLPFKKLSR